MLYPTGMVMIGTVIIIFLLAIIGITLASQTGIDWTWNWNWNWNWNDLLCKRIYFVNGLALPNIGFTSVKIRLTNVRVSVTGVTRSRSN